MQLWQDLGRWEEVEMDASKGNKPVLWTPRDLISSSGLHQADPALNEALIFRDYDNRYCVYDKLQPLTLSNLLSELFSVILLEMLICMVAQRQLHHSIRMYFRYCK